MSNRTYKKHKNTDIINYVTSSLDIHRYRYKILEYVNDLNMIDKKKHYISPNYNGVNSILVFVKLEDRYCSYLIDRKSFNTRNNEPKITKVNIRLDESLYKGSIMECVVLYGNDKVKTCIVTDMYMFRGEKMFRTRMDNKMLSLSTYLETFYKEDSINNVHLIPNKLYDLCCIKDLVNTYIPKSKYKSCIKGLAFYPEYSSTKLLYMYNNCNKENQEEYTPVIVEKKINISSDISANFRMKSTDTVDVFNLYLAVNFIKNGKSCVKYKKYGIAYIPTTNCSYFCRDLFTNTDTELVKCAYSSEKDKWIPYEKANVKIPNTFEDVSKMMST